MGIIKTLIQVVHVNVINDKRPKKCHNPVACAISNSGVFEIRKIVPMQVLGR
jgi:hypothetical protein